MVAPLIGAALIGAAATGLGTMASYSSAKQQMSFQRQMSNTSYQRAMADMRAAGLNPMLAYQQGGASTPGGASWQMPDMMQSISSAAGATRTGKLMDAEKANIEATTAKTVVDQDKSRAETALRKQEARSKEYEADLNQLKLKALRGAVGSAKSLADDPLGAWTKSLESSNTPQGREMRIRRARIEARRGATKGSRRTGPRKPRRRYRTPAGGFAR